MDEIRIEGLEVFAYHGVYPEENEIGQSFYVNVVLYTDTRRAGKEDKLSLSTNYGEVCQLITDWLQGHTWNLIETVAESTARQILLEYPLVKALDLEVRKPQAPIGLPFESVSVKVHRGWHRVYLSIGSNMGNRKAYIEGALEALKANEEIRIRKISDLLETSPYGGVEQEDFLNGAVELDTLLSLGELLDELHSIEQSAGRERLVHWGPRTLDLDILFYDKKIYEDEKLIIPHVDMQNRYFVLKPMAQIAPFFRHPILHKTMAELLDELSIFSKEDSDGE